MFNPFRKSFSEKEIEEFRFLSRVKLFERLSYEEMALFLPYMFTRHYSQDEVVFFRNDPSQALYIIRNGEVSLNVDVADKFEVLSLLEAGCAFGENSLLENTRRIYTSVVVSEGAEIMVIPQVNILDIFENHANIKAEMLTSLSDQYNTFLTNLFTAYRTSFGFFDLSQAYIKPKNNNHED